MRTFATCGLFLAVVACLTSRVSSVRPSKTNSLPEFSEERKEQLAMQTEEAETCSPKYELEICPDLCPAGVADRPGCMKEFIGRGIAEREDTCFCGHKPYPPGPTNRFQYECIQANLVRGSRYRTTKENCKNSCRSINNRFPERDFSPESGSPYICFTEDSQAEDAVCLCNDQKYAQTGGRPPNSGINLNFPKPQFPSTSSPWFTRSSENE